MGAEPARRLSVMPRLELAVSLTGAVLKELRCKRKLIKQENDRLAGSDRYDERQAEQLEREKAVSAAIESLTQVTERLGSLSSMASIAAGAPPLIPVIRAVGSGLLRTTPHLSMDLYLASSTLGGVVMDSGAIIGARFNLQLANCESARILNEAKLIADSKINKLHPNLYTCAKDTV